MVDFSIFFSSVGTTRKSTPLYFFDTNFKQSNQLLERLDLNYILENKVL